MPLVSAARGISQQNFRVFCKAQWRTSDTAEDGIAGHSRLILFAFCVSGAI